MRQQCLDFGTEQQGPATEGQVYRLDAVAVAGEEKLAAPAVPDRQGEHAVEAGQRLLTPFGICGSDHLGVGLRAEAVPGPLELGAQLAEVVDLAVVGDDEAVFAGGHRLAPGG